MGKAADDALEQIKQSIPKTSILAYFNPKKPNIISSDASALGTVLLQERRPVVFAAKSLASAQRNYSQIEKELMAI